MFFDPSQLHTSFDPAPKYDDVSTEELRAHLLEIDVVVLTTTDVERQALHEVMKPLPGRLGLVEGALKHVTYRLGQLGRYFVAHVESTQGSQARHGSSFTVNDAISELLPKAVIVIGIAFGLKPGKQQLGDVIVAESVIPYELQRLNSNCTATHRGQPIPCGPILSERFRTRRADWRMARGQDRVNVFQGELLSGEKLSDNLAFRDTLAKTFPNALAGEMEGVGVYTATDREKVEVILVKAICDWGDGTKTDDAQPFAAKAAVSLVCHVLSKRDVLAPLRARDRDLPGGAPPSVTGRVAAIPGVQSPSTPHETGVFANPPRAPLPMFLAESGIREAYASVALVGCAMIQHPNELSRQVKQLHEDLLHERHLPQEEKQRLRKLGFQLGVDHPTTRQRMLELLSVADFDLFVFYARKSSRSGDEDALRTELLKHVLESRLSHPKWPVATVSGNGKRLPELLRAFEEESIGRRGREIHLPLFLTPATRDPVLLVMQYACDIVRARLEQVLAGTPHSSQSDADRIRTKLRMAEDIDTRERFHRERPLP